MQKLENASLNILVILLQDKSTLKKVPRWLRGYLRANISIEKDDPMFFRKLVMGMLLKVVEPYRPGGSQFSTAPAVATNWQWHL